MTDIIQRRNKPYAPRMSPEERREQLLDATLQVIVRDGIHKVSIDSVARQAGVTRPVVYDHFPDTNALLRASLDREEQAALAQLAAVLPTPGAGDPIEAALAFLAGYLDAVIAAPDRWRAAFALVDSTTPEFRRHVERGRQALIVLFEELIGAAIHVGRLPTGTDSAVLARALFALAWDAGRTVLAEPDDFPPDRIVRFAQHIVGTTASQDPVSGP